MKMATMRKNRLVSLTLGTFIITQILLEVFSGASEQLSILPVTFPKASRWLAADAKQVLPQNAHSCYACSTMDYENPADNLCRYMPKHLQRAPGALQPTVGFGSHVPSMMNYPTTSTLEPPSTMIDTTTTSSAALTSSAMSSLPASSFETGSQDSSYHRDSYNQDDVSATTSSFQSRNLTNMISRSSTLPPPLLVRNNSIVYQSGQYLQRNPTPGNFIRTRNCLGDENFCSIVSVVRIEVMNDSLVSRFWAMERNCSKSCNTGCMLIGERVRLRVCSQCCRTPNCNTANGAHTILDLNLSNIFVLLLMSAIGMLLNKY